MDMDYVNCRFLAAKDQVLFALANEIKCLNSAKIEELDFEASI